MQRWCCFSAVCCLWSCLFFAACGLDQFYLLEEPTVTYNTVYYSTDDYMRWYVEFLTNETANSEYYPAKKNAFTFLGTEIYYKIYDSTATLSSHKSRVEAVNKSDYYSNAATMLIETFKYQTLGTDKGVWQTPFVECSEKNTRVRIRLMSYNDTNDDLRASVRFGGVDMGIVPRRNDSRYSFDFFNKAEERPRESNVEPVDGDSDYWRTGSGSQEAYYVQLYAVAVGRNNNYTLSYSLVLDLGTIPILKNQ